MALVWYCSYCSVWQPSQFAMCPTCGRGGQGRSCRKCKNKVPGHALFCPACGGDSFIEPARKTVELPRMARLGVGLASIGAVFLAVRFLPPLLGWIANQALNLVLVVGFYVVLFQVLTAFLPDPWRQHVRSVVWWCVKTLCRGVSNLFR